VAESTQSIHECPEWRAELLAKEEPKLEHDGSTNALIRLFRRLQSGSA